MNTYMFTHVCVCLSACVCMFVCMCVCSSASLHMFGLMFMYICVCVSSCVCEREYLNIILNEMSGSLSRP